MMPRSPAPPSPAFEATARGAQFRDRIAIVVKAPPEAIFEALHNVTLRRYRDKPNDRKVTRSDADAAGASTLGARLGAREDAESREPEPPA